MVDGPSAAELWRAVPVSFSGWALDGADQVSQVDVIVGNNAPIHANTGLSRPDIPVHLGDPAVSAWSGWRAAVDLSAWPDQTVPVRVIARGAAAAAAVILDTTFTLRRDGFAGQIENPAEGTVIGDGVLVVAGWAVLDGRPPAKVEVLLDGSPAGSARLRLTGYDLPAGTPPRVGDFAGFEYRGSVDPARTDVSVDVLATGGEGSAVRFPTRKVSFAPATTSPEVSSRAALLRSRSLAADARAGQRARRAAGHRPRMLVFTHDLGLGASQLYVRDVLAELMPHLESCVVVSPSDGAIHPILERLGVDVLVSGRSVAGDMESYEGNVREMVSFVVRSNADIVLLNTLSMWTEADAAQRAGLPTLWAIHDGFRMADWLLQFEGRRCDPYVAQRLTSTLSASERVLFESDVVRASFSGLAAPDRLLTMARGIEVTPADSSSIAVEPRNARSDHAISDEAVVFVSVGTCDQGQSPAAVAEAFIDGASKDDKAVLVLVGDHAGLYEQALHRLLWASGCADRVLLIPAGDADDIRTWYASADVLVVASDNEASRHSVLEAMAFSVPVLSASVDGVADVIADGVNGWVCPPRDVGALTTAIRRVLALKPDARRAIGEAARETVHRAHSRAGFGATYAHLLEGVLDEGVAAVGHQADTAVGRVDEALGIFQSIAETSLSVGPLSDGPTSAAGDPLAEFNSGAPWVRDGIATFIAGLARDLSPGARVIDVGAGDAPYRDLFSHVEYITVDWEHSSHPGAKRSDIIASAESLPLDDASADAVLMTELLEHVSLPSAVLREAARVLRPHGVIAVTVPFVWMLHEMPHDYFRYTPTALHMLLEQAGFDQVAVRARGDYFSTLAQLMQVTPQWITSVSTDDGLDDRRHLAGRTMEELSHAFAALAPLDAQGLLPLGFNVSARRVG